MKHSGENSRTSCAVKKPSARDCVMPFVEKKKGGNTVHMGLLICVKQHRNKGKLSIHGIGYQEGLDGNRAERRRAKDQGRGQDRQGHGSDARVMFTFSI